MPECPSASSLSHLANQATTKLRQNAFPLSSLFFMVPSIYEAVECYHTAMQTNVSASVRDALITGASLFFLEEMVGLASLAANSIKNSKRLQRASCTLGVAASTAYAFAGGVMHDPTLIISGIIFGAAIYRQMHTDKSDVAKPQVMPGSSLARRVGAHLRCTMMNIKNRTMPQSAVLEMIGIMASARALYSILPGQVATTIITLDLIGAAFLSLGDGVGPWHSPSTAGPGSQPEPMAA